MNEIQQKSFTLLCELDDICRKNEIRYYLAGRTALSAYVNHEMPSESINVTMMIMAEDCIRFMDAVSREMGSNRVLESMCNNSKYPVFNLKYTDTESLALAVRMRDNYKVHGISVYIIIVEGIPNKDDAERAEQLKHAWREITNPYTLASSLDSNIRKSAEELRVEYLKNPEKTGQRVFSELLHIYTQKTKKVQIRSAKEDYVVFKRSWFEKGLREVEIEGRPFLTVYKLKAYLKLLFGEKFLVKADAVPAEKIYRIVDATIPYEEFVRQNPEYFDMPKFTEMIQTNNRINREYESYNQELKDAWSTAEFVGLRMKLRKKYKERKVVIMNLKESYAYDVLEKELTPYLKALEKYAKQDKLMYFDEDIFKIALTLFRRAENKELVKKLKQLREEMK